MLSKRRTLKILREEYWVAVIIGLSFFLLMYHYTMVTQMVETTTVMPLTLARARYAVNPWATNIFFIDVYKSGGVLNASQACAVESAAKANPEMNINVIFAAPVTNANHTVLHKLIALGNVKFSTMNIQKFAKKNLLRVLRKFPQLINNIIMLKILLMLRFGGIFLDFDSLVVRPLQMLPSNWVVKVSSSDLASEIMSVSTNNLGSMVGRLAMRNFMREVKKNAEEEKQIWDFDRLVMTKTLKELCSTSFVPEMNFQSCHGVKVYDKKHFLMTKGDIQAISHSYGLDLDNVYVLHLKDSEELKRHTFFKLHYPQLLRKFCPISFRIYGLQAFI